MMLCDVRGALTCWCDRVGGKGLGQRRGYEARVRSAVSRCVGAYAWVKCDASSGDGGEREDQAERVE